MSAPLPPFSFSYTPSIPENLLKLKASIAITTYQAGKVVFISPKDENNLIVLPRSFDKPMGLCLEGNKMVLATNDEVITFSRSEELGTHYPNKQNTYDSLFVPRSTHYTGRVDMHDIAVGKNKIFAVNTSFSCVCEVGGWENFNPIWQPNFIEELSPGDSCHLNGLVMHNDNPKYVTALGKTNTPQGWRDNIVDGGLLIDIQSDEIVLEGLAMPHSPQMINGELYMLLSASGQLIKVDPTKKSYEVIKNIGGFVRGMAYYNDYLFVGASKLRKNSSTFAKLQFAEKADFAGIKIYHLPTAALVGEIVFESSVDEIYEVAIIPDSIRPNILNTVNPVHKLSLEIPGKTFWARQTNDDTKDH
ncbi:MAG: TIGR03032 family protein [Ekhidna sp.]|nr:TIGR03032 family protein [Ekhidna sp.]